MATPSEINKQFQLEKEAISCGKERLHDSLRKLEEKSYASASVYGTASIAAALPAVIKGIEASLSKLRKGNAGQYYKPVAEHIDDLEPLAIATIALKVTFDNVFSMKRDADLLTNVLVSIGSALEAECKLGGIKLLLLNYSSMSRTDTFMSLVVHIRRQRLLVLSLAGMTFTGTHGLSRQELPWVVGVLSV
jgi:hypothetical protein